MGAPVRPDVTGVVVRDGVRVAWDLYERPGAPTVLLLPTWSIIHSRFWKLQIPFLARRYRVVVLDGRGCGRSDRPHDPAAYSPDEYAADAVAVLDATGTASAVAVGLSAGATWGVALATAAPERVDGFVAIAPSIPSLAGPLPDRGQSFTEPLATTEGWAKCNLPYWRQGPAAWRDFLDFFFAQVFSEPHSTKQIEDAVGWGLEADPEALGAATVGAGEHPVTPERCAQVACPVLVMHGDDDRNTSHEVGARLAELTGARFVTIGGGGHVPLSRDPVVVDRLIEEFVDSLTPPVRTTRRSTWTRAAVRRRRALYLSSPIGLGHARRDVAVARKLRRHHPDLEVDWLAQHPVTQVLADAGERVHPASRWLASESAHIEDESADHDLHAFQAVRRMDEILVHNFLVFDDVVRETPYDLVVADEAWDVDYFLHENPELKRYSYAWMTDFVGWLPMPWGGGAEAALTADYNAEMIEQRSRYRRLRDASVFVGNPGDVVDDAFGPGLPGIREWTERNFSFSGYVTGFEPPDEADRRAARESLGCRPDELLVLVTVGGSGVGEALLRRVLDAAPLARRRRPELRFVVVAGPRIDPAALPRHDGVDVLGYLPDLYRHLAACDLAVVQGGLTTCMELAAAQRPFLYVPLRDHFEQNLHVRHRLDRYAAGRCVPYEDACDPDLLAEEIVKAVGTEVRYRPVETDGAARAAALLADLF
ncbi:pimeloyl-ACP methyl ester carboxylesterase [Isoptericola jiangsuensis]|uniref:Pimeloyl-ACP methyl ester carboxylesterase n=1 Tax=Isoptericola jiangsuensis TaxID=548579 RepID=A0A2A9EY15_9MICO|nr:alpha/beta fold hydrolase [Isoptericola jiangsuensis]PFG43436.1 pimeloyl-ACP methyl ester carboxylesterase [Isoptericola jiangsuensis]